MTPESLRTIEILKAAARISDHGYGEWAYSEWVRHNEKYFNRTLKPGGIFWGLTPHGHFLGYYEQWRNGITLHTSLVKPSGNAWGIGHLLGERFASDVLLHEMIHQQNYQAGTNGKESHNCNGWCDEVNRLIPLLGLEGKAKRIKQKRIDKQVKWYVEPGHMKRGDIARFPHSLRPAGYYEKGTEELLKLVLSTT